MTSLSFLTRKLTELYEFENGIWEVPLEKTAFKISQLFWQHEIAYFGKFLSQAVPSCAERKCTTQRNSKIEFSDLNFKKRPYLTSRYRQSKTFSQTTDTNPELTSSES